MRDAGVLNGGDVVLDVDLIGVDDKHREDFERVAGKPGNDHFEFGLPCTGVEEVARGVAVVDGLVDPVCFTLDCFC